MTTLSKLPPKKVKEVSDFADHILKKYDEEVLQRGIEKLIGKSKTFNYLKDEEISIWSIPLSAKYKNTDQ